MNTSVPKKSLIELLRIEFKTEILPHAELLEHNAPPWQEGAYVNLKRWYDTGTVNLPSDRTAAQEFLNPLHQSVRDSSYNEFEDLMVVCQYLQILRTYLRN
jgi:hypothetical protein